MELFLFYRQTHSQNLKNHQFDFVSSIISTIDPIVPISFSLNINLEKNEIIS